MSSCRTRYLRDCFVAALVYVLVIWGCVWLLKHPLATAPGWQRALVSLVPMVPIVFAIRLVVRMVLAGDELQRRIDLEALAVASLALSMGSLTLSLLMVAQVISMSGRAAMTWIFPALWVGYGFARHWAARRYR